MPQVGERRSGATETVEWNGSRWMPAASSKDTPPEQEGAIGRFFGGAMATSPLNPMNLVRAAGDLPGTAVHAMTDPLKNFFQIGGDLKDVVTNERGGGPIMGRVTSAAEALKHLGGSVPLIGPAGVNAGDKIGNGDIAGGAGELTGLASSALFPKITQAAKTYVPPAMIKAGGAMERGGTALAGTGLSLNGLHVPLSTLGILESLYRHSPEGAVAAATPYALKYAGKGIRAAGEGLEGLKAEAPLTMRQQLDAGASKYAQVKGAKATFDDAGYSTPDEGAAVSINDIPPPNMRVPSDPLGANVSRARMPEDLLETQDKGIELNKFGRNVEVGRTPADTLESVQRGVELNNPFGRNVDAMRSPADSLENVQRGVQVDQPSGNGNGAGRPSPAMAGRSKGPAFSHSSFLDSLREMAGEKPSGNGNGNGSGVQIYHAQDLLDNPGSRLATERGIAQNRPLAEGVNAEAGIRRPASVESGFDAMHRAMMEDRTAGELDLPSEPLTEMEKLAARSAERFGRRFRPEF